MLSQLPTSLPNHSPTAKSLAQLEPTTATFLHKPESSGEHDKGNLEDSNLAYAGNRVL